MADAKFKEEEGLRIKNYLIEKLSPFGEI